MKSRIALLFLALAFSLPLFAEPGAAERALSKKKAEKKQIMHSMIGIRDTLLFYTFGDQQAVLRLRIDNKTEKFAVKGTVYLFDPATTKEGLGKWLNNQHSDGLFADVPKPTLTTKLPEDVCLVTGHKVVNEEKKDHNGAIFREYKVKVSVKAHKVEGKFQLETFTDEATVFVKQVEG